jgi:hypothetical protein
MLVDDGNGRDLCPYCEENVNFDELRTKTLSRKHKKVKAIVQRCPECKRIVDLDIPSPSQTSNNG